jgi:hypothetical protein
MKNHHFFYLLFFFYYPLGSMGTDNKMRFAIEGTKKLINLLDPKDYVSIITFDSQVEVLYHPLFS